ncbi:unnamed protein product [Trifolium pratense]|uniref:Uncharacterized protein n=1 Tax=Trifolium pratense TaxID=57577 RepID=A0ACB0LB69_TRIPR|nr:unnamed protein product [Trifolium pratense]
MSSGTKTDPPKHQNKIGWKPNAGVKINETEEVYDDEDDNDSPDEDCDEDDKDSDENVADQTDAKKE